MRERESKREEEKEVEREREKNDIPNIVTFSCLDRHVFVNGN